MEPHLPQDVLVRVFAGRASDPEVEEATAHLAGCAPCWDRAAWVVAELKRGGSPLRFEDARRWVLDRLEQQDKAALCWLLARASWTGLKGLDAERQVKRLKAERALQTRAMFDTVLADAIAVAHEDPCLGEERALVAHALAGLLPLTEPHREDLRSAAMQTAANCRRMIAYWTGSASALGAARRHFEHGTGNPALEVRLLSIQASLASDTGHLELAPALLGRAAEIARHSKDLSSVAALAVQEANTLLAACRHEEAIARAEEALGLLAPSEMRLELLARSALIESLVHLRRPYEALRTFAAMLPLFEQLPGRRSELQQGYLEALLLDVLGFAREAQKAFGTNISGLLEAEQYKDAFLTMLTYFDSLIRRGLPDEAERACMQALAMTERSGSACHAQMIELWRGLLILLRAGRLAEQHLVEARQYLVRYWHAPAAHIPLQQRGGEGVVRVMPPSQPSAVPQSRNLKHATVTEPAPASDLAVAGYREEMEHWDRALVARALAQSKGRIRETTRLLGIARDTLRAKIRKYGLEQGDTDALALPAEGEEGDPRLLDESLLATLGRMRARASWGELASLPVDQQVRRLESAASLRTREMLDTILGAARAVMMENPHLGEQRALVAHALTGLLPGTCSSRRKRADLQADAMMIASTCRRLAGNFTGCATALDTALSHLASGTGDSARKARLYSIQASLAADTGHVDEALTILARAETTCRRSRNSGMAASIVVQEANTLLTGFRFEEAITRAEFALRLLPPGEIRLAILARSIVTESLALLGRGNDALVNLYTSLPLFEQVPAPEAERQLSYLEALILDALGYAREAEIAFRYNLVCLMEAERYKDALLTLFTQFERLCRRGDLASATRLGRQALRLFEDELPVPQPEVVELWRNLLALVEDGELTDGRLLQARDFAMSAFAPRVARPPELAESPAPSGRVLYVEAPEPVGRLAPGDYTKLLERRERQLLAAGLAQCQGRVGETCRLLGISEPTLREKIRKYELRG